MYRLTKFMTENWRSMAFVAGVSLWLQLSHSLLGAMAMGLGVWAIADERGTK